MQRLSASSRPSFWQTASFSLLVAVIAVTALAATPESGDRTAVAQKADKKADKAAAKKAAKADAKAAAKAGMPSGQFPANNISFTKNIAPVLVAKCGRCHVSAARGKFSMATFEALKKGPPEGVVIMPGKSSGSRLVDVIESGDMPRGGAKVTKAELTAISKWIDEGAKFDGGNEKASLASLVPGSPVTAPERPRLQVVMATGKETVKFSTDIAPMLVENCMGCHGGQQPANQLQMDRFVDFIRGGQSGLAWVPEKPDESLLIKKLKGTAGKRMPLNRPALSEDKIAKFDKWISEGARFDGEAPTQSTRLLAALTHAKAATHDELSADRMTAGKRLWALSNPSDKPVVVQTKNLIVISGVPEDAANEMAQMAEQQAEVVAKQLHTPANQPLAKGRILLFIIPNRYSYSEFGKMVENRPLPNEWRGHWKYNVVDAYAVVIPPTETTDYSLPALIAQELAAVHVASLAGAPPSWFSEGSGRVLAGRLDARSARVRGWSDRLRDLAPAGKMDTFINRGLPLEDNDVAAYGFVKELAASGSKYNSLLAALRNGEEFDRAFPRLFGPLPALAAGWAKNAR
jgi:hypothetical protein